MKRAREQAERWYRQARYDFEQARRMLEEGVFSYAAFFAEQAAQKALKAYLLARGERAVPLHSVAALARRAAESDQRFAPLVEAGRRLDRHYLTSRYPDALPEPAIPAESYTREDAEDAVAASAAVLRLVHQALGYPPEEALFSSGGC
jgi:HEPN domain-containing protein